MRVASSHLLSSSSSSDAGQPPSGALSSRTMSTRFSPESEERRELEPDERVVEKLEWREEPADERDGRSVLVLSARPSSKPGISNEESVYGNSSY
jgi:hypothetical protein